MTDSPSRRGLLWPHLLRYRLRLALAAGALLIAAGLTLSLGQMIGSTVDAYGSEDFSLRGIYAIAVGLGFFSALRFYHVSWLGERVCADLRCTISSNLIGLDPPFYDENRPSEIQNRLTNDLTLLQTLIGSSLSIALRNSLTAAGSLGMLLYLEPGTTLFALLAGAGVLLPVLLMARRIRRLSRISQDNTASMGSALAEVLHHIKMVHSLNAQAWHARSLAEAALRVFSVSVQRIRWRALVTFLAPLLVFAALLGIAGTVGDSATEVSAAGSGEQAASSGAQASFWFYLILLALSSASLSEVWGDVQRALGAGERLGELLGERSRIRWAETDAELSDGPLSLHFESVSYAYPTRPDIQVLDDFSVEFEAGVRHALVGRSGAGKSTLLELALRFDDIGCGCIRLGGRPLGDITAEQLRRAVAWVPQNPPVFHASIAENIACAHRQAGRDEIEHAAERVGLGSFISGLKDGYETLLGEHGIGLSGGQRQRLALARLWLRRPQVLLLDEPTSALDAASEQVLIENLEALANSCTLILVTHREVLLSSVERVIWMEHGSLRAVGRHAELLEQHAEYAHLWRGKI
ncbi:MAG: ATP-binding cassette domain-containing protein [Gammaproteobacteria bacterium AqS3]|nr:ATP-binding cassette domain-containing protein [Gammaproteobacteria bacterium AqS3]